MIAGERVQIARGMFAGESGVILDRCPRRGLLVKHTLPPIHRYNKVDYRAGKFMDSWFSAVSLTAEAAAR